MAERWRIDAALERAKHDVDSGIIATGGDGRSRRYRVAIGDPQAPFGKFLEVLEHHRLLGDDGRLSPDALLVSMGDHFDWGEREDRNAAADSAMQLVSWLGAHPTDQVVMILGNHDTARVGELAAFDDARFRAAREEADRIYSPDGRTNRGKEQEFLARNPDVPTAESVARDFSTFREEQRDRVVRLLLARRFHLAHAVAKDFVLSHAGVTDDELDVLGLAGDARRDAFAIAAALDDALQQAFAAWRDRQRTAFAIPGIHRPGNAAEGEARGMLFHRPSDPAKEPAELFAGPPRRRFDPRCIPAIAQAIGHIRDRKCRRLLHGWTDGETPDDGPLRILETDGTGVRYRRGTERNASPAAIYFTDNGMSSADPARYELLDLDRRAKFSRTS